MSVGKRNRNSYRNSPTLRTKLFLMEANILFLDISSYCSIFIMPQYVSMEIFKYNIFDCNKTYPSVIDYSIYVNVKILDYTLSFFPQLLIFSEITECF